MLFNSDSGKQVLEIWFSHIRDNGNYPSLVFNDTKILLATSQKHLGLILYFKLDFNEHIYKKINKLNKILDVVERLSLIMSRKTLLAIKKSFVILIICNP